MSRRRQVSVFASCLLLLLWVAGVARAQVTWEDISPDFSDTDGGDPDGASGGRVNGLGIEIGSEPALYAASEWGGIYKSTDGGLEWARLNTHLPSATWDVEVDPSNPNRVYATSFFDGKTASRSGINVSTDGGATWTHPASSEPPAGFCANAADETELTAHGISIDPLSSSNVFIGTSCGLARSTDSGATWNYVDPTGPAGSGSRIWDVLALGGGVVHVCGDDGHLRSDNGGSTWVAGTGLPSGRCAMAVSPDESYVLLAVVGTSIFETETGNQPTPTWTQTRTNPSPQGRIPFVETNQRSDVGADDVFDLWFGDVSLFRVGCTTPDPPAPGGSPRCGTGNSPPWAGGFTRTAGAHDDTCGIVFFTDVAVDACPLLMCSDGGVYWNTDQTADCHNPDWEQPDVTPHGLWPFSMSGFARPGADEDLYFGNQDNGLFGTLDPASGNPSWHNDICCDGFDTAGDAAGGLYSVCCFGGGRATRVFRTDPGFFNSSELPNYPSSDELPSFEFPDNYISLGGSAYVMITRGGGGGVFFTPDIDAGSISWTELGPTGSPPPPGGLCGLYAGVDGGGTPTIYAHTGSCASSTTADRLFRYTGTNPNGTWTELHLPQGGFGVVAVKYSAPTRIIASGLTTNSAAMFSSTDGGNSWSSMPVLDDLMDAGGAIPIKNQRGPTSFTGFNGYWQPSMVAFDPESDWIAAGAQDAGVFVSFDDGANWTLITDPFTSDTSGVPHLPRPRYGRFDREGGPALYVGSQGRGIWRAELVSIFADGFESGDTSKWDSTVE